MFEEKLKRILAQDLWLSHHDGLEALLHPNEKARKAPPFKPDPFQAVFLKVAEDLLKKYDIKVKGENN